MGSMMMTIILIQKPEAERGGVVCPDFLVNCLIDESGFREGA